MASEVAMSLARQSVILLEDWLFRLGSGYLVSAKRGFVGFIRSYLASKVALELPQSDGSSVSRRAALASRVAVLFPKVDI